MDRAELLALADRVDACQRTDNKLDVLVEIALFKPGGEYASIRANGAGTKVIYTDLSGKDTTYWAEDWTLSHDDRVSTAAALRALASTTPQAQPDGQPSAALGGAVGQGASE